EMMKCRNRTNIIEVRLREVPRHRISQLKLQILKLTRSRARHTNHLRRQIQADHSLTPPRQSPRERTRPTANLKRIVTMLGNMPQKGIVILIIRRPPFIVEKCETIEICFDS